MTDNEYIVQVSVIVPVYKVEAFLPRCIDSILAQTFSDFELILVDDGSPDNCGKICDEYAKRDGRIRVIHQQNMRVSAARNAGIEIARGKWISLIDPDDWVHKDYLKILLSGVLDDTDLVICDCLMTSDEVEDKEVKCISFRSANLQEIYSNHIARTRAWGRLLRRRTVGEMRFIPGTEPTEDSCFNELFYRDDMKFRITEEKLYYYYIRPDSAVHSHRGRGNLNAVEPLLKLLNTVENISKRRRIIMRCYKYIFAARYGEMYEDDYPEVKRQCNNLLRECSYYLPELGMKDRTVMRLLSVSPGLYRAWRLKDDPSLIRYEKMQRGKRRQRQAR